MKDASKQSKRARKRSLSRSARVGSRIVPVLHATKRITPDPGYERQLAAKLRRTNSQPELLVLLDRFVDGSSEFDALMRRVIWRVLAKRFGNAVVIGRGIRFKHIETFEIGDGVFIGDGTYIQGRFDGRFRVGRRVWIGPGAYFDARDIVLEDEVGWAPAAKALCSQHTALPSTMSISATDVDVRPIRIRQGAAVGMNAMLLPGVTVGRGTSVGAGAIVTRSVPAGVIVVGAPARVVRRREARRAGEEPPPDELRLEPETAII